MKDKNVIMNDEAASILNSIKNETPIYPDVYFWDGNERSILLSTILRVKRKGKYYKFFYFNFFSKTLDKGPELHKQALLFFMKSSYEQSLLYRPEKKDLDTDQISEKDRYVNDRIQEHLIGNINFL